jgi:hypothetical protein
MMFDTFAQAAISNNTNAPNTGDRIATSSSVSGAGVACSRTSALMASERSTILPIDGVSAA